MASGQSALPLFRECFEGYVELSRKLSHADRSSLAHPAERSQIKSEMAFHIVSIYPNVPYPVQLNLCQALPSGGIFSSTTPREACCKCGDTGAAMYQPSLEPHVRWTEEMKESSWAWSAIQAITAASNNNCMMMPFLTSLFDNRTSRGSVGTAFSVSYPGRYLQSRGSSSH